MKPYLTVLKSAEYEYTINKSRFIAVTTRIRCKEDAHNVIENEKRRFPGATHHCWAYILEQSGSGTRFSDDGEPGGTAGMPILEVMKKQELCYCVTVVTRYFGGILLGAGGLVRAYTHSAAECTKLAGQGRIEPCDIFDAAFPYSYYERIGRFLAGDGRTIADNTVFGSAVTLTLCTRASDTACVHKALTSLCDGNITFSHSERTSRLWPE